MTEITNNTTGDDEMKDRTSRDWRATGARQSTVAGFLFLASLLLFIQAAGCSGQADTPKEPAKPPEPKNQTYRMIGGRSVISLVSSDELEIREGGQNIVCKYTKQDDKLRVVVSAFGATTANYFNMTPEGLVDEDGDTYYEPATYEKVMAQIELNRQLWAAVQEDDASAIEDLLRKGAAVENRDQNNTALVSAVEGGKTNAVAMLLKYKADPNQTVGSNGETPLWKAIVNGDIATTEMLLTHGARVDDTRNDGVTPLMLAASLGGGWRLERKPEHDKIVSMLCQAKVDLNSQNSDGDTALALALKSGNLEAVKILVASGADRNIGKDTGHDAVTLAGNDEGKVDAISTPDEREAREKLFAQYPELLIGVRAKALYQEAAQMVKNGYDATSADKMRQAAEMGSADAQTSFGSMCRLGLGVTQNYKEAAKWHRLAADQGNAKAQSALGDMYSSGHGVAQDYKEAIRWYRLASDQGDGVGQMHHLAWLFATCPDPQFLNGQEAVRYAQMAVNKMPDWIRLGVLAAAHARTGNFEKAVDAAEKSLVDLQSTDSPLKASRIEGAKVQLECYRNKQPWTEKRR